VGFKAATHGDIDGNINSPARALSKDDTAVVAAYIAGLQEP
jgi:hypothetical protein